MEVIMNVQTSGVQTVEVIASKSRRLIAKARMVRLENNRPSRKALPAAPFPWQANAAERRRLDELLDDALKHTFPASDPVAIVQQAPERPKTERRRRARHDEGGRGPQDSDL
jgi:hypothetical protein